MVKPLPQLEKLLELWDAMGDFMWRGGISGQTDSRGWPKGTYRIWRNVPIGSSIHQWNSYLKSLQESGIIIDPVMERAR